MKKEYEFLANNPKMLSKHRGEWIAVTGKKVIACGKVFKTVADKAREICKEPVFFKVPREGVAIYIDRISIC